MAKIFNKKETVNFTYQARKEFKKGVREMAKYMLKKGLIETSNQLKQLEFETAREVALKNYHAIKEKILLTELGEPGIKELQKIEKKYWKNKKQELKGKPISKFNPVNKKPTFKPKIDKNLKDWIFPDYIDKFIEIEKELFIQGFIDNSYKWQMGKGKGKIKAIDFLYVLSEFKFFKPIVKGNKIQNFNKRQFISNRYELGKTGLSETAKKNHPTLKSALIPFSWIEKPG